MMFRRGSLSMIAGPPGSMKTVLALNIVRKMGTEVPTLYHSSDSDDFTVASRSLAMIKGITTDEAELLVMTKDDGAYEALKAMEHVRWSFKSSPTMDHMWAEAEAFREIKGTYPHHTVIDIMMDVDYEGAGEQNYWALMAELKDMARDQETALTVVHHTSESAKGGAPPPRSAIMGKANQLPTLILTLWGDSHRGTLDVATVKNRFGPQDAMGKNYFTMKADPAKCFIDQDDELNLESELLFRDGPRVDIEDKLNVWSD
jgi:predicted ATP-dependent serine protease